MNSAYIARGLQAVGVIALVVLVPSALLMMFSTGASRIDHDLLSPDGKYRAIHASTSTGAVGYCYQFVILVSANQPVEVPSYRNSKNQAVFSAGCEADVGLVWLDSSHLKFTIDLRNNGNVHLNKIQRQDPVSHVHIQYEIISQ